MNAEPTPNPERRSFWTTLPGILTGLGSLVVAITGLLALIIPHCSSPPPPPSPTPTPTPAPAPTPTPSPTPTPTAIPTPINVVLRRVDIRAIAKNPTKEIPDDVTFSLFKGTRLIDRHIISFANHPWQTPQVFSFKLTSPVQLNDTNSLQMKIQKRARRGHTLILTLFVAGELSDGRTPPLYPTHHFTLGAGDHPNTQPVYMFPFNSLSQ